MPLAQAQNTPAAPLDFSQLARPNLAPARLQLKNLDKGWRRMTVDGGDDSLSSIYGGFRGTLFQDALTDAGIGVYFTKGQSVVLGSETFLVAYRAETKMTAQDLQDMFQSLNGHGDDGPMQGPRKFPADTTLLLSLLNLRTVGSLKDVRPFYAAREIMGPSDVIEASDRNLGRLGRFLTQISERNRYGLQRLPLRDAATLRQTFNRYFHPRQGIFVHPQTGEAYRTNAALATAPMRLIANSSRVVAIYEARPGTDGKYGTVFLDGHTERVPVAKWAAVRAVLPQKPGPQEIQRLSDANLRQLRSALLRYTRQRGGTLPPMQNASALRRALTRSIGGYNATYYAHPTTAQAYRPNSLLSGKNLRQIGNQTRLVALYEATPGGDGKRSAIFLDGHIERIAASDWKRASTVEVSLKAAARSR